MNAVFQDELPGMAPNVHKSGESIVVMKVGVRFDAQAELTIVEADAQTALRGKPPASS